MNLLSIFRPSNKLLKIAFGLAAKAGVTNDLIDLALKWARVAKTQFATNTERREFVIRILMYKTALPESICRLAVALADQLLQKELDKKP